MDLSVGADLFVEATPLYRHDTRISIVIPQARAAGDDDRGGGL
jgi:hypothetical protein